MNKFLIKLINQNPISSSTQSPNKMFPSFYIIFPYPCFIPDFHSPSYFIFILPYPHLCNTFFLDHLFHHKEINLSISLYLQIWVFQSQIFHFQKNHLRSNDHLCILNLIFFKINLLIFSKSVNLIILKLSFINISIFEFKKTLSIF